MAEISLEPISSADDIDKVVQIVQIRALFTKEFHISDFEWDDDELYASFLDMTDDQATRAAYIAERALAITEAKEYVIRSVQEELNSIQKRLGQDCPFFIDEKSDMFLLFESVEKITPIGLLHIATVVFLALGRATPWVNAPQQLKDDCSKDFAKIFEMASTISLAGLTESRVWYLGRSRSVYKLMRILKRFCRFIGTGELHDIADLDKYVKNSNDGGIDALGVSAPGGVIAAAPMVYLLGATIQKSNRSAKVIGSSEKARFRALFSKQPMIGFEGVMAVPFQEDEVDQGYCRDADCRYLHGGAFLEAMRRLEDDQGLQELVRPQFSAIRRWGKKASLHLSLDIGASLLKIA